MSSSVRSWGYVPVAYWAKQLKSRAEDRMVS